jgi:glycosyltransferase involved in cell wall biosynthesis
MNNKYQTVMVIPCYNEEKRLQVHLFLQFLNENKNYAFLFVNDGSKDNTWNLLQKNATENECFFALNLEKNGGKAEAVRKGMLYAAENYEVDYIGFWDADLATPLFEIPCFVNIMQEYDCEMITGLRLMRLGARVMRKGTRHYLGRIFATTASKILKLPVYDTQCGAKLYKKQIVTPLFKTDFITKWLFDVEILARYIKLFGRNKAIEEIYEYPLHQWEDIIGSQLKIKDFIKAPFELFKIKKSYL